MAGTFSGIVWVAADRTVSVDCTNCPFLAINGSYGEAREHVRRNPGHLVQVHATVRSTMILPGGGEDADPGATDQISLPVARLVA